METDKQRHTQRLEIEDIIWGAPLPESEHAVLELEYTVSSKEGAHANPDTEKRYKTNCVQLNNSKTISLDIDTTGKLPNPVGRYRVGQLP